RPLNVIGRDTLAAPDPYPPRARVVPGPGPLWSAGRGTYSLRQHLANAAMAASPGVGINRQCNHVRFSWLSSDRKFSNPQTSLRNVHVEALRIFPNPALCGLPYTTRNNMEHPHANFGGCRNSVVYPSSAG